MTLANQNIYIQNFFFNWTHPKKCFFI